MVLRVSATACGRLDGAHALFTMGVVLVGLIAWPRYTLNGMWCRGDC